MSLFFAACAFLPIGIIILALGPAKTIQSFIQEIAEFVKPVK